MTNPPFSCASSYQGVVSEMFPHTTSMSFPGDTLVCYFRRDPLSLVLEPNLSIPTRQMEEHHKLTELDISYNVTHCTEVLRILSVTEKSSCPIILSNFLPSHEVP